MLYTSCMKLSEIALLRLQNQHLATPDFTSVADAVSWFGAVQAQDYLGSLWAVGQRMNQASEDIVEQAIAKRFIVRSWPMRGTLHFTHAKDLRWMLQLLAPRVIKRTAFRYKELELSPETLSKSESIIIKALVGGKELRRDELFVVLDQNGISPSGQRGIHILSFLAMKGLICFGSRNGKQFTFTLLDEWIPPTKPKDTDEALAELAKRYFLSHGPATIHDFAWWSGLTRTEVRRSIELIKTHLTHETLDEHVYYFTPATYRTINHTAYFLPAYDEFTVAYKDRRAIIDSAHFIQAGNGLRPTIVFDGKIIGTWIRELKKHEVIVTMHFFSPISLSERNVISTAANRYGKFLGRELKLL